MKQEKSTSSAEMNSEKKTILFHTLLSIELDNAGGKSWKSCHLRCQILKVPFVHLSKLIY